MKRDYYEGKEIRNKFEETMAALFQVRKSELEKKPKPEHKKKEASKD